MRVSAQMLFNLVQQVFNPRELLLLRFGHSHSNFRQCEVDCNQQLPGFVVYRVCDTLELFLQGFVQLPQRLHGILKSPVGHLIGRNALRKKFSTASEQLLFVLLILRSPNQINQHLVMQGSQLHDAYLLLKRSSSEFVGSAQSRSEEHTSELQSPDHLVCRLLLEKKKNTTYIHRSHSHAGAGSGYDATSCGWTTICAISTRPTALQHVGATAYVSSLWTTVRDTCH